MVKAFAKEYQRGRKKDKGAIFDGFAEATGYQRRYAARLLRHSGRRVWFGRGVEVGLVAHEGGRARGDYAQTLDLTDVSTGWAELAAVKNKAQVWVFEAIQQVHQRLPFPLLGLD